MRWGVTTVLSALLLSPLAGAQTVVPAAAIDRPMPDFPEAVGNIKGVVKLHFTIDKISPVIDATAVAAMANWTYKPRTIDGQAADQPH